MNHNIDSSGVLFAYLAGQKAEDGTMQVLQVNNYLRLGVDFLREMRELESQWDRAPDAQVFCILGTAEKTRFFSDAVKEKIAAGRDAGRETFPRPQNGREQAPEPAADLPFASFCHAVLDHMLSEEQLLPQYHEADLDDLKLWFCFGDKAPRYDHLPAAESALAIWLNNEQPFLFGKQVMFHSFSLRDLRGRRIISAIPEAQSGLWFLLLEGGMKVYLHEEIPYIREKYSGRDAGLFTIGDIDTILNNPLYAYGSYYSPIELCEEWHKVFQFVLAAAEIDWDLKKLAPLYEAFLRFLAGHICETTPGRPLIEKRLYLKAMLRHIENVRSFLRGEESPIISRDLLLLLDSRHIYLQEIYRLLASFQPRYFSQGPETPPFDCEVFHELLAASEQGTNHEKGKRWEQAAEYFIAHIRGLRISGRRVRAGLQEIDLGAVNISVDGRLWELGAYLLIECKNWFKKADLPVVRSLAHVTRMKGNHTSLLVAKEGITADTGEEILRQARQGLHLLAFSKEDLLTLRDDRDCYHLLLHKYAALLDKIDSDVEQLG